MQDGLVGIYGFQNNRTGQFALLVEKGAPKDVVMEIAAFFGEQTGIPAIVIEDDAEQIQEYLAKPDKLSVALDLLVEIKVYDDSDDTDGKLPEGEFIDGNGVRWKQA